MDDLVIGNVPVRPGETRDIRLKISESYTGGDVSIPLRIIRATQNGPNFLISGGIHGDELNGFGIVHHLMFREQLQLVSGSLILVPVINVFGFETNNRYLPDRRDLNRSFPGSINGSLASRIAHTVMHEVIQKCDYAIDCHTAAVQRTNYPNIRGDLDLSGVRRLSKAFGCELIIDGKGPVGSLRREACKVGCQTVLLEAGEPLKIEPAVVEFGIRGVRNALIDLGMISGTKVFPPFQTLVRKTTWVRAAAGGILSFHIGPGDIVEKHQPVATNYTIMGEKQNTLLSPIDGVILGMATLPTVKPGEPVYHVAQPARRLSAIRKELSKLRAGNLYSKIRKDLATNITVVSNET